MLKSGAEMTDQMARFDVFLIYSRYRYSDCSESEKLDNRAPTFSAAYVKLMCTRMR